MCEIVQLYRAAGEIVLWDLGAFIFVVTGSGAQNSAELRLRANVLGKNLESDKKISRFFRSSTVDSNRLEPAEEEEQSLYSALKQGE